MCRISLSLYIYIYLFIMPFKDTFLICQSFQCGFIQEKFFALVDLIGREAADFFWWSSEGMQSLQTGEKITLLILCFATCFFSSPESKAQWAFLIKICLLSIVIVVNFSHFHLLLPNYNQTWQKASMGKGIQICSNEGPRPFPRGINYEIVKIHWQN